ncbi:MAG: hypothetical protein ACI30J_02295 [Paludibacteraceae bacterium]
MKKLTLVLALLIGSIYGAKALNQERVMFVVFNYENGIYRGAAESDIIGLEADWYKDRPRYEGRFFEEFAEPISNITGKAAMIRTEQQLAELGEITAPIVRIEIISVDKKGNTQAEISFTNPAKPEQNAEIIMRSKGGTFGTWLNLFGDGMEHLAPQVASWIAKIYK